MATRRVEKDYTSPSTELYVEADLYTQNQLGNYSTVRYYVGAINRGGTTSYSNYAGSLKGRVGGAGNQGHSSTLPSGVPANTLRWEDGPFSVNRTHADNGIKSSDPVSMHVTGWFGSTSFSDSKTGSSISYPRIPKRPSVPGTPVASNLLPTSVQLDWAASEDDAGSAITGYLVRRWVGATATGPYEDVSEENNLSRLVEGLTPGTVYTFGVYAKNGAADNAGYSNLSATVTIKTVGPARVRVSGVWKYAAPYVRVNGIYVAAQPFVKVNGFWKATG